MKRRRNRLACILHLTGNLLKILGPVFLAPLLPVLICWGTQGEGWRTLAAFGVPAALCFAIAPMLCRLFKRAEPDLTGSMLFCALAWLLASALGALPFVIALRSPYIDGYFEAMSGFTTTGITVFSGLDDMPRSILFWRAVTQWVGGLGILSFFLAITFRVGGAHHIFGAESHKIAARRPVPGLFNTLKILWTIYALFTVGSAILLILEGMPPFDALCHSMTALSTGGFSPHDSSIAHYRLVGHPNFRLIEYTVAFVMMLGGINFLVHYRVLTGTMRALWDNIEIRWWWGLICGFCLLILLDNLHATGTIKALATSSRPFRLGDLERAFRYTLFQVVSILTTTGFGTKDIGSSFFPVLSRQLFLVMMVIGGCVGSTGGGIKVLRVAILHRLMLRQIVKLRISQKASHGLVIDQRLVPQEEIDRVVALFFAWLLFLIVGAGLTAFFSHHGIAESFSGMASAVGNIGPCYLSVAHMKAIHPVVKICYILGMLAGRLEMLPLLLLFWRRAWT